jgi:hypothetical protein
MQLPLLNSTRVAHCGVKQELLHCSCLVCDMPYMVRF